MKNNTVKGISRRESIKAAAAGAAGITAMGFLGAAGAGGAEISVQNVVVTKEGETSGWRTPPEPVNDIAETFDADIGRIQNIQSMNLIMD